MYTAIPPAAWVWLPQSSYICPPQLRIAAEVASVDPPPERLLFFVLEVLERTRVQGRRIPTARSRRRLSPSCSSPAALASRRRSARRSAPSRCRRPTGRCAPSSHRPCATRAPCRSTPTRPSSRSSCATTATATKRPAGSATSACATPGPFIGTLKDGKWTGTYFGTHAPVMTWYSPDMVDWLKSNRAEEHRRSARGRAGPRRRDHGQGDVPAAGRRLRQRRSAPPDADVGRRHHGARRRRLARRLVLGLVRLEREE